VLRGLRGEKQPGPFVQSERSGRRDDVTLWMAGLCRGRLMEYRVANIEMRLIFRSSTVFEMSVAVARKCCILLSADDDALTPHRSQPSGGVLAVWRPAQQVSN